MPPEIDEDWFNTFEHHAEDASSEQLQQLFGRILADEIKWRGSYSRRCLNFVGSLDKDTAELCEWAAERSISNFLVPGPGTRQGEGLAKLMELEQLGLIGGVGPMPMTMNLTPDADGDFLFFTRRHAIQITGPATLSTDMFKISRLGQEVFSLLHDAQERALRMFAERNRRSDSRIVFGTWQRIDNLSGFFTPTEVIQTPTR